MRLMVQKNGAPDVWYGGRLCEVKRGKDRLSDHQRTWHQNHYLAYGEWPRIVFFPDANCDSGCVFLNFMEFEQALSDLARVKLYKTPGLTAIFEGEYSNTEVHKENADEVSNIQSERAIPTFAEPIHRGGESGQGREPGGAGSANRVPFRER